MKDLEAHRDFRGQGSAGGRFPKNSFTNERFEHFCEFLDHDHGFVEVTRASLGLRLKDDE